MLKRSDQPRTTSDYSVDAVGDGDVGMLNRQSDCFLIAVLQACRRLTPFKQMVMEVKKLQ